MANKKQTTLKTEQKAGEVISKTEVFFEKHQKPIYYVLIGIVLVVLAFIGAKKFYFEPKNVEAAEKLVWCEQTFARDSFQLALNGDGINAGYIDIVSDYSFTDAKKEAALGAATCSFKLGQFDEAIDYAKKATNKSFTFAPVATGLIGDCYVEKGDLKQAVKYFEKAADFNNEAISPIFLKKAADIYLFEFKDNQKALKLYQTIKDKYFQSPQAQTIDKFIELAK
ncbi:MAG: tetratricopeptide repeat protein [Prevotellaceae bacterium]|jgi:tetratricopeptide (TPR) repeat protein|nr:tetratricopeptide repeat protein [Prevotellaceae bacterium]